MNFNISLQIFLSLEYNYKCIVRGLGSKLLESIICVWLLYHFDKEANFFLLVFSFMVYFLH